MLTISIIADSYGILTSVNLSVSSGEPAAILLDVYAQIRSGSTVKQLKCKP